jgi:hypothetical protein
MCAKVSMNDLFIVHHELGMFIFVNIFCILTRIDQVLVYS